MSKRDEFSKIVKDELAKRVGYKCSNPSCQRETVAPHSDKRKSLLLGDAAHITAASPNGPRYDNSLTSDERKSIDNGIWLCKECADKIDREPDVYSVAKLIIWKNKAEIIQYDRHIENGNRENTDNANLLVILNDMNYHLIQIHELNEYFYIYWTRNFRNFRDFDDAMYSFRNRFHLHESAIVDNASVLSERKDGLRNLIQRHELTIGENLYQLLLKYISSCDFIFQSDIVGLYNNYYEELMKNVIEKRDERNKLRIKINKELHSLAEK